MTFHPLSHALLLAACLQFSSPLYAEFAESDPFDLSIEEILQLEVTVASKQPETLFDAPGSITAYQADDMARMNYFHLSQLADITAGYSNYRNIGENTFETRGQMASGFDNNRHLLLIDDIPMNHVRAYTATSDQHLPLYFSEQVEFLRGPASALYGVSAFSGVVKIKPKTLEEAGTQVEAKISGGNYDDERRLMGNILHRSQTGQGALNVGLYDKEASKDYAGTVNTPTHLNYDDQSSQFLYGTWGWHEGVLKGLKFGGLYMAKEGGLGNFWANYSSEKNNIHWQTLTLYTKYQRALSQALELKGFLKYNHGTEAATYYDATETLKSEYDYPFHSYEGEIELHWDIAENHNIIFGAQYDQRHGQSSDITINNNPSFTHATPKVKTSSLFMQYKTQAPVLNGLLITAGVRNDTGKANSDSYSKLSPRLALVQKFNSIFNLKVMYGEAIRGPSVKEIGVNDEVSRDTTLQLTALQPEEIKSFEIAPYVQYQGFLGSVTFYKNETTHYLVRDWASAGEYVNQTGLTNSQGIEMDLQYQAASGYKLFGNYTYAKSKTPDGQLLSDIPINRVNAGVMWSQLSTFALSGAVVGKWRDGYSSADASAADYPGYTLIDTNVDYHFTEQMSLGLQVQNLFDESFYLPANGVRNLKIPGRTFLITFSYNN